VWAFRAVTGGRRTGRFAAALATGLGVIVLAISVALPVVVPMIRFPRPTGPFGIGTLTYHWVDADRPEPVTAQPGDRRELMVQVWYPADAGTAAPRAAYLPDADVVAPALARFLHLPAFALGHLKDITTNAVPAAPVADDQRRYPVVVLLVGQGGTYRQVQTFQVEELVSHGYVVAAIDQPYAVAAVVFPDGRQVGYDPRLLDRAFLDPLVPDLALDVGFTLDQLAAIDRADPNGVLTGRLDLRQAGLVGHSLGGIVGGQACLREPRLRACLLEDAFMPADVVREGLQQPAMWITRDAETMRLERRRAGGWAERDISEHLDTMRAVFESLPGAGYYVEVPGIFHLDMTDAPLLSPLAPELGIAGPIGAERAHAIVNACTLAFFDRHLRDRPAPLLDGPSAQFPDVRIETRGTARP
jgi:predicted dienelactone hydrolase